MWVYCSFCAVPAGQLSVGVCLISGQTSIAFGIECLESCVFEQKTIWPSFRADVIDGKS